MSTKDTKQTGKDSCQCKNIVNNKKVLLVLDSSVLLKAVGYDETIGYDKARWYDEQENNLLSRYLKDNRDRVRIPKLVYSEVTSKISLRNDHDESRVALCEVWCKELSLYNYCNKNIEYSKEQLSKVEKVYALDTMSNEKKLKWIDKKRSNRDTDQNTTDLVEEIHHDAKNDRIIVAYALALAEKNYVYLIADDRDFLLFSKEIAKLGEIKIIHSKTLINKEIERIIKEYEKTHITNSKEMSQDEKRKIFHYLQFNIFGQFLELVDAHPINMNKQFTGQTKSVKKSKKELISNAKMILRNGGMQKLFEYLVKESKKELISNAKMILRNGGMQKLFESLAKESELKYIIYFGNMEKFIEKIYPDNKSVALIRWKDIKKKFETNS